MSREVICPSCDCLYETRDYRVPYKCPTCRPRCSFSLYGAECRAANGHDGPHHNGRLEWDDEGKRYA